ncbi:patatin-like phospholipase family protein [bacterium]|nr:patatin-like phospholipase family protein [candidate division CSSED10-310 bacterium]
MRHLKAGSRFPAICFVLFLCYLVIESPVSARPRIGLALGGGGARGAAHIGVLRVLEANRIPIDCIAGTSMGAIVGGLYAAGYSPDDIERELTAMDWGDMFDDTPQYRNLSFRRKEDVSADLFPFEVGIKGWKLMIPGGLLTGQKIRFKLQTLTLHTEGIASFDDLMIPFRAMATDIETGEIVVLSRGNLAEAIHASFAIPGIIQPVCIEDRLLVDGGLVSNVPVQAVRDMGADIIIAVDVGADLSGRDKLASLTAVTKQVMDLMIHENVSREITNADIVISPVLHEFTGADFELAPEIIACGVDAAETVSEILVPYRLSRARYLTETSERRHGLSREEAVLGFMELRNASGVSNRWIVENLRTKTGRSFDIDVLKTDLEWLYQTNEFTLIDFRVVERDGKTGLCIDAAQKPWGNDTLRLGLTLTDNFEGDSFYSLNARYTNTRINTLGAELRVDATVGREGLLRAEFYQPLAYRTNYFTALTAQYRQHEANQYLDSAKIGEYRVDEYSGKWDLGVELGRYGEMRVGFFREWINSRQTTGQLLIGNQQDDLGGISAQLVIDQLDDPGFPTRGIHLKSEYTAYLEKMGCEGNYQIASLLYQSYGRWAMNTVFFHCMAETKIGRDLPLFLEPQLGGPFSLSAFDPGALTGQMTGVVRLGYFRRVAVLPAVMGSGLYSGGFIEAGNAADDFNAFEPADLIYTFNAFLGFSSFLGPLFVGYSVADSGEEAIYVRLGHIF